MANMNIVDGAEQEKVRRGPHIYVAGDGRHGIYKPKPGGYLHEEYPKVMDKNPAPQAKQFKGQPNAEVLLENARREWSERQQASIVHNRTEEEKWNADHANDPAPTGIYGYPKTMDRTPRPATKDFANLEDYRAELAVWKEQIAASIVHDQDEEELWNREHSDLGKPAAPAAAVKTRKVKAA